MKILNGRNVIFDVQVTYVSEGTTSLLRFVGVKTERSGRGRGDLG